MSLLPRKDDGKIDYKNIWEVRLLRGIFMFFVYLMLVVYVLAGIQSLRTWTQLRYYGGDFTTGDLVKAAEEMSASDNQVLLPQLLMKYPLDYNQDIEAAMLPLTPKLNSYYFFAMASRYHQAENMEEAFFWSMLARFRLRFDAVRCQDHDATVLSDQFVGLFTPDDLQEDIDNLTEEERKGFLKQVLEWDEQNPAYNSPRYFCKYITALKNTDTAGVVKVSDWETMRKIMRAAATAYIEGYNTTPDSDELLEGPTE